MKLGVVKEKLSGENRVALVPDSVRVLSKTFSVFIEKGVGDAIGFSDQDYKQAGAKIVANSISLIKSVDILCKVRYPISSSAKKNEITSLKKGAFIIGLQEPLAQTKNLELCAKQESNVFALEFIPRITIAQSMDVLSSMATVAGYKAVLLAMEYYKSFFPMFMTAAGTIRPARVLILGGGVAGLQALATAKRLGAIVEVFDVRPDVKEQVESLGGKFIEMPISHESQDDQGYAKEMTKEFIKQEMALIEKHLSKSNVCITTAQIFGKKPPLLIKKTMLTKMSPGGVIVDLATTKNGGNCEISKSDKVIEYSGVTILAPSNLVSSLATDASRMISKNIESLLNYLYKDKVLITNLEDPIVGRTLIMKEGRLVSEILQKLLPSSLVSKLEKIPSVTKKQTGKKIISKKKVTPTTVSKLDKTIPVIKKQTGKKIMSKKKVTPTTKKRVR